MIKFHSKNKRKNLKLLTPKSTVYQGTIRKSDAKLRDIAVNGVKLPGYEKLSQ